MESIKNKYVYSVWKLDCSTWMKDEYLKTVVEHEFLIYIVYEITNDTNAYCPKINCAVGEHIKNVV